MSKPANTWRYKGLTLSAWSNKEYISFTIQKRYMDKVKNEWKETKTLFIDDIRQLETMLKEASDWHHKHYHLLDTPEGQKQYDKPVDSPQVEMKPAKTTNINPFEDDDDLPF